MSVGYVRVSFNANALKKELNAVLDTKIKALTTNKKLANDIARVYGEVVTPYVPRSDENVPHHLQKFYVSDGRVMWTRTNRQGTEIGQMLYNADKNWVSRASGGNQYGGHQPQSHWVDQMAKGGDNWQTFVQAVTPLIKDELSKHG